MDSLVNPVTSQLLARKTQVAGRNGTIIFVGGFLQNNDLFENHEY